MDQEHLRSLLSQLQGELSRNETLDERSRQLLFEVQGDIRRAVEPPLAPNPENGTPGEIKPLPPEEQEHRQGRFQQAIVALENSHPQLASALEQGAVALSNLGL